MNKSNSEARENNKEKNFVRERERDEVSESEFEKDK